MKTILMHGVVLAMLTAAMPAQAETQLRPESVEIAYCKFERSKQRKKRERCHATASVCLAPGLTEEQCKPRLDVSCNGRTVFDGQWEPGDQEDPPLYIIRGIKTDWWDPVKIEISPRSREKNPAVLSFDGREFKGNCKLTFDLLAR